MPRRDSSSDSDRGSYRRRRERKRNSSSPDSRGNSESNIDKTKRKTYRSRSRSGSHSRSSRRRSRSRSLSARKSPRRYTRRSRSSSRGRTSRRSRSGSGSRRRRSRSGSRKPHRRSKSSSPKQKTLKKDSTDYLKQKVQQAIKAAANASAELREKGLLSEPPSSNPSLTIGDQLKRAQAIDDINSQSFVQQEFISSRNVNKTVTPRNDDIFDKDGHMSAIFGLAAPKLGLNTNAADASIKKLESWKENPEMLVHESLFVDQSGKQERWLKKLFVMRKKKINEDM